MYKIPSMISICKELWPHNRSITGNGTRKSLSIIKKYTKVLKIKYFKTGEKCFDWKIPKEWNVKDAYIITPEKKKICKFKENNLHLVGYSEKVNKYISLRDLKKRLHSNKKLTKAIPYLTSYYKKYWGFCISQIEKKKLKKGKYRVFIDSTFKQGKLNYGECLIKGRVKKEIFFSTYICHPSMANNELSGPVVMIYLINYLLARDNFYSYRFIFIPETIGSISYLSRNIKNLRKKMLMGFNITCVGDDKSFSFLPSKYKNSPGDSIIKKLLGKNKKFKEFEWDNRGSDERQYCSPGIDLPVSSLMKTKYGEYDEYHTSEDKIGKTVTSKGLKETLIVYKKIIKLIEKTTYPVAKFPCEPFLTKYNLYETLSGKEKTNNKSKEFLNFLTWCDGKNSLEDIGNLAKISKTKTLNLFNILRKKDLIKIN